MKKTKYITLAISFIAIVKLVVKSGLDSALSSSLVALSCFFLLKISDKIKIKHFFAAWVTTVCLLYLSLVFKGYASQSGPLKYNVYTAIIFASSLTMLMFTYFIAFISSNYLIHREELNESCASQMGRS